MSSLDGPFLQAACLCERVLEDKDGVLSAIRIVDRVTAQVQMPPGMPAPEMPPIPISLWALISFKAGAMRGTHTVHLVPKAPSGLKLPGLSVPVLFEGDEDRGVNLRLQVNLGAQEQGLYWFEVLLDDQLVTKMPLRVLFLPLTMSLPPQL